MNNVKDTTTGWIAVIGASIVFGSTGIPMKSPGLHGIKVNPYLFAANNSIGIFIASIPSILYLLYEKKFSFKLWSIVGSIIIATVGYFSFQSVHQLGYAKASATWASVGLYLLLKLLSIHTKFLNLFSYIFIMITLIQGCLLHFLQEFLLFKNQ